MPSQRPSYDPVELPDVLAGVSGWLDGIGDKPPRTELSKAVRLSMRALEREAPGRSVEVRVPPFAAGQCGQPHDGPQHSRGTPPNVVETDPRTWLQLATGRVGWSEALGEGRVHVSGTRADLSVWLPLAP